MSPRCSELARLAVFALFAVACGGGRSPVAAPVSGEIAPPATAAPPPPSRAPVGQLVQIHDAHEAEGPFASLEAYCAATTRACTSAGVLCACDVADRQAGTPDVATITVQNSERFQTDASFRVSAILADDGWHVSKEGVEGHSGAETGNTFVRRRVALASVARADVVGDAAPEVVLAYVQTYEERRADSDDAFHTDAGVDFVVVCSAAPPIACTPPIEVQWGRSPRGDPQRRRLRVEKDALDRFVVEGEADDAGRTVGHAVRFPR